MSRIAGIDFGTVRIGIAITDVERTLASPYENYTRRSPLRDAEFFRQFVREAEIESFVVGLPLHTDGRESQKSQEARQYGQWLRETTELPVEFFDERFTTVEAEQTLIDAGLTNKQRKTRLDKLAAQIMLSAFLETQQYRDEESRGA